MRIIVVIGRVRKGCRVCGRGGRPGDGAKVELFVRRRDEKAGRGARVSMQYSKSLVGGGRSCLVRNAMDTTWLAAGALGKKGEDFTCGYAPRRV